MGLIPELMKKANNFPPHVAAPAGYHVKDLRAPSVNARTDIAARNLTVRTDFGFDE